MLDQFCAVNRGYEEFRLWLAGARAFVHGTMKLMLQNRTINFSHLIRCFLFFDADDDAVRMKKIIHSGAFAQEFRVRRNAKRGVSSARVCRQRAAQFHACPRRHGAFFHDEFWTLRFRCNLLRNVVDRRKVRAAIILGWRSNANKDRVAESNRLCRVRRAGNLSRFTGGRQHFFQVLFVNGDSARFQLRDAGGIDIRAHHLMSSFGEASSGYESYVATSDYR